MNVFINTVFIFSNLALYLKALAEIQEATGEFSFFYELPAAVE
jgi:hypothetical protein